MTRANLVAIVAGALVLAAGGPWLYGQLRSLPAGGHLGARSDQRIVTLEVTGMTCTACEAQIEGSLATVKGVSTAEARHQQNRAYVVCDRSVADSTLLNAVASAGRFHGQIVQK